jgi:hypothetical protein
MYRFDVAGTVNERRFVAFDSTGTSSQISSTTLEGDQADHSVLATWDHAGEVVDLRAAAMGANADFLLSYAAPADSTDIRLVNVTCPAPDAGCKADQRQKVLPSGVELRGTSDHAIVEISGKRLRTFVSAADYFDDKASLRTEPEDGGRGTLLVDGAADRLVLARRPDERETPNGIHRATVLTTGGAIQTTFVMAPANMNPLHAVGLYGPWIAFALQPSSLQLSSGTQLWVCPAAPFERADARETSTTCDVYDPPEDASYPIGVATNDLSSLGIRLAKADFCDGFIVVRQGGWLWLVDPVARRQDIVPGTGLVNCSADRKRALVYRMRRLDEVAMELTDAKPSQKPLGLIRTGSARR